MSKTRFFILFSVTLALWTGAVAQQRGDDPIDPGIRLGRSLIMGQVTDESGSPLIKALVSVRGVNADVVTKKVWTDSVGHYCLNELPAGIYIVKAEARDFLPEFFENATNLLDARPLTLGRADTLLAVDFSLSKGGEISGAVTTADNQPIADAQVSAWTQLDILNKVTGRTDATGAFTLKGLATAKYIVSAAKAGYVTEIYRETNKRLDATPVQVTAPETTAGINFTLNPASAISGVISNERDGIPLAGARVTVFSVNPKRGNKLTARSSARTDDMGVYIIPVDPGNYVVQAQADGFMMEYFDNAQVSDSATTVSVKDSAHTVVNLALTPLGRISGHVTDALTGRPIVRAHISLFNERKNAKRYFETRSDSLGVFNFKALPADDYLLKAEASGYVTEFWQEADSVQNAIAVKIENGQTVSNIVFTLSEGACLNGHVRKAADATPIPGALVTVTSEDGRIKRIAGVLRDGSWTVGGLVAGKYFVSAAAFGFVQQWYDSVATKRDATLVEVQATETKDNIDFSLSQIVRRGAVVSGWVTDDSTKLPISNAAVIAVSISRFGKYERTVTDSNGYYKITGLAAGRYVLLGQARNFIAEYYDNAKSWRKAEVLSVALTDVITDINFALAPQLKGGYLITGRVKEKNGQAAAFALVNVAVADEVLAATVCEEDGQYALTDLPADEYQVSASTPGYQDAALSTGSITLGSGKNIYDASILMVEEIITGVDQQSSVPQQFSLEQNYPNPFNPTTEIRFTLAEKADVTLTVYNLMGQVVAKLYDGVCSAGTHQTVWDGLDQNGLRSASGVYLYRLQAVSGEQNLSQTKSMILMK